MSGNPDENRSITLRGLGVSPGVAIGPAFLLTTKEDRLVEREIADEEIPREVSRFEDALVTTRRQLHEIKKQVAEAIGQESARIFDAHLMVVEDPAILEEVIRGLKDQKRNVEVVLSSVTERYARALANVNDDYLRERASDVRDVSRRIQRNLAGRESSDLANLDEHCVLVANDLAPSETAVMDREKVIAFATDVGSMTSHTAIMARAMEIPAIVGLHDVSIRVSPDDRLLIDGQKGILIINPTDEDLERYGKIAEVRESIESELATLKDKPPETRDGYHVMLSANLELPSDVTAVIRHGANGVGLFRSEFLYLAQDRLPSEDEQVEAYERVAAELDPAPVIIRTLDLGGDKFVSHIRTAPELNPFLGWRAIRFCLAQPDIFLTQLRAILRVSVHKNVKLMVPMISNVDEMLKALEFIERAKTQLREKNLPFNEDMEVGAMIEVPSAALTAKIIAPHVHFFSLGTNDLIQYTLAVDRVNERIAHLYEPTHPAIIQLIKHTVDVAHAQGKWVGLCGEMASNPIMVPLLIGLGVDELSVSANAVPIVKDTIRHITYAEAEQLAAKALTLESGAEIEALCRELTQRAAPEILELIY